MSSTRPNTHRYVVYLPYIEKGRARPFRVSEDADVQDLINEICQYAGYKNALDNQIVDLYKCGSLERKPLESLYGRALDWLRGHAGDGGEKTPLDPADRLNEYFPEGPTSEHEKMVDIIAMVGSTGVSSSAEGHRDDSEMTDMIDIIALAESTGIPAKRSRPSEEESPQALQRQRQQQLQERPVLFPTEAGAYFHTDPGAFGWQLEHVDDWWNFYVFWTNQSSDIEVQQSV
ncbi:uncharacterized protein FOMMEDRAFT_159480, partial [Fomitiporia mediterranea MF3/22]|uniref:uncharacterized protein n=1 Tax=Fomitiporia mediterranea (strain MF3/22) TaxID=694068 RepID=UPI0004407D28